MPDPASWWLALLVYLSGGSACSADGRYQGTLQLLRPFLSSCDAIDRCGLTTDDPKLPVFSAGNGEEPEEGVSSGKGEQETTATNRGKSAPGHSSHPLIVVKSWGDLAIGIDVDSSFLAVSSVLESGSVFPKERAIPLPLKGERWKTLLYLLARSDDGNTAKTKDLFHEFGYLTTSISRRDLEEIRNDVGALNQIKTVDGRLTSAIGDLSRQLRRFVSATNDEKRKSIPLSKAGKDTVKSGFMCRYLLKDSDGKLRFGEVKTTF
jgi:hypothetical protein